MADQGEGVEEVVGEGVVEEADLVQVVAVLGLGKNLLPPTTGVLVVGQEEEQEAPNKVTLSKTGKQEELGINLLLEEEALLNLLEEDPM